MEHYGKIQQKTGKTSHFLQQLANAMSNYASQIRPFQTTMNLWTPAHDDILIT